MSTNFQDRLKELRGNKPRYLISELCGLPPDAIRRYEAGEATPRIQALEAIADYFGCTTDYLLGRTDHR